MCKIMVYFIKIVNGNCLLAVTNSVRRQCVSYKMKGKNLWNEKMSGKNMIKSS